MGICYELYIKTRTFVKPAQPNMDMKFTPHPEYWITLGDFEKGEVLDIGEIINKQKNSFWT